MSHRLTKSKNDVIISGVCGGIAEYFEIDSTLVRVIFMIFAFISGFGILLYFLLLFIMPEYENSEQSSEETIKENIKDFEKKIKKTSESIEKTIYQNNENKSSSSLKKWVGIILIILGLLFLLNNFGIFKIFDLDKLWPILLIIIGIWIFSSYLKRKK